MPNTYVDNDINIYCDVRDNKTPTLSSKWKCMRPPYNTQCNWNNEQNKCIPSLQLLETKETHIDEPTNIISKGMGKSVKSKSSKG